MNNTKKKFIILTLIMMLTLTGCAKNFRDETTKKAYTENILCQPETDEVRDVYESNKENISTDIEKLPKCEDLGITSGGYEGLWTSIFVKPLAFLIVKLGLLLKSYGLSIMVLAVLIRLAMFPLNKKSLETSKNMQKIQPELEKLEKKYMNKTDQASQTMKAQEMMLIYKKYNVSPFSGCLFAFLQIPIFFAFLEAINRIPVIFEETLFGFHLGVTPTEALSNGDYYYLILVALILVATYFSFKNINSSAMSSEQQSQMKFTTIFMIGFIGIASFSLPAGIAFYWIVSNCFTIAQNAIINKTGKKKKLK